MTRNLAEGMNQRQFDPDAVYSRPVFENRNLQQVAPEEVDQLLSSGWRYFGSKFFRMSHAIHAGMLCGVMALRLDARRFCATSGMRRVMRKNVDASTSIVAAEHGTAYDAMFLNHRQRFRDCVPESLHDFLAETPATVPCPTLAVEVRFDDTLAAVSFLGVGANATSAIYGMFDPAFRSRGLGTFTMLQEILWTATSGRQWYYLGYAYTVSSPYDYKLRFPGLEVFDWSASWHPLPPGLQWGVPWTG